LPPTKACENLKYIYKKKRKFLNFYIKKRIQQKYDNSRFKPVSGSGLGLTHPRRNELQHGTFLRFGHPRLIFSVRLLATSTKICTIGSSKVSHENLFEATKYETLKPIMKSDNKR